MSAPAFWEGLYAAGQDGWELGVAAPPLAAWLDAGGRFAGRGEHARPRVAVPGCGRGHDARLLAARGADPWGFDFAGAAIAQARDLAARDGLPVTYQERDVFTLGRDYAGFFDGVWEYTCFCAIDPPRRLEYARMVHAILRPGGTLLGCFYPLREGDEGPPFPVSVDEVQRLLAPLFRVVESGPPARSAERRRGLEWLIRAERR